MGRSKFPGKPSKTINRKRISVVQLDDETKAAAPTQLQAARTIPRTTTTTTSESTEQEQTQKDAEDQEDTNKVFTNKHVKVTKNTLLASSSDAQQPVIAKTEKRKNGAGGARHCYDNTGANEEHRHREDDDDDSDNNVNYRQRAMKTKSTSTTYNTASSGNKSNMSSGNNGNVSSVNGKMANDQQHQHKSHKYLPATSISVVDELAEDSQYSSDDYNQHEVDEGAQQAVHKVSADDNDDQSDDEDNESKVDLLFPTKQHLCDSNGSISWFGKSKSSSPSSSSYATAFSPSPFSPSSHSSNCSSSSSTSGCGISRNHHVDNSRWHDGKGKGNNRQMQRKKFANLNLAKAEVMLPSTSKWKESGKTKNAALDRSEQQEKLLNCYISGITSSTTTATESSCNLAAAVTSALSDCITTTTTSANVLVSLLALTHLLKTTKTTYLNC